VFTRTSARRTLGAVLLTATLGVVAACGQAAPGGQTGALSSTSSMPGMSGMPTDEPMPSGNGLAASVTGYTFEPTTTSLPADTPAPFTFRITGPDGHAVTQFQPEQSELLHFYLIRSDLTGFAHLHPTLADDGTWSIALPALVPGSYRVYVSFSTPDAAGKPLPFVLSRPITVPGTAGTAALPPASPTTSVDGYTLTLSGRPMTGMAAPLTLEVTQDGQPVTDLQPYLSSYAHLSAFHAGDLAFAHLHPEGVADGDHGGPKLTFDAAFPSNGSWRMYVQFQTDDTLHTAVFTVDVG
jgi:hypothetical protein